MQASAWVRDGRNSKSVDLPAAETDENGFYRVESRKNSIHRIIIRHKNQTIGLVDSNYKYWANSRYRPTEQVVFFTDRSIYRPGQTVKFKGICIFSDTQKNDYKTIPNREVGISIYDVNNQEIEKLSFRTNEFGSFSGSFTAPKDRATGAMRILASGFNNSSKTFRVEEYKRPKFFVEVEKPDQQFQLNADVVVKGQAKAYTGAAIDGAKVKWRVVREVRYPDWWTWRRWWNPPTSESQEIDNGESTTEVDGSFEVKFRALPDLAVDRESEPVFTYSVYADVTDTTGETRSDQARIRIGYTSMAASLNCGDWQVASQPVELNLSTKTLDGESVEVKGALKVYRLKSPEKIQRSKINSRIYSYASRAHQEPDMSQVNSWPLGELVAEFAVATVADGTLKKEFELQAGAYKAVFETRDDSGQKVSAEKPLMVLDPESSKFAVKVPHHLQAKSWSVEVGDQFKAVWGTGYESGRAYVELVHRNKTMKSFWTEAKNTQQLIELDVDEKLRGGFTLRITYVRENRAYTEIRRIDVPWTNKKLQIKWERFVSKLQPGDKVTWTAVVSGPDAEKSVAEMVAAMYDASLDAFVPNSWPQDFGLFYRDDTDTRFSFQNQYGQFRIVSRSSGNRRSKSTSFYYRQFTNDIAPTIRQNTTSFFSGGEISGSGFGSGAGGQLFSEGTVLGKSMQPFSHPTSRARGLTAAAPVTPDFDEAESADKLGENEESLANSAGQASQQGVDLSNLSPRKNLSETAFFYPNLTVNGEGEVRIEFEAPEALTKWKVLGFAHDNELRTALLTDEAITSKDLMVQPNSPRFLREGDQLEFSVKVSNQSATRQTGQVRLSFANALDESSMDQALGNVELDKSFDIPAGQSKSYFWKLKVPDFVGVLTYKAVGGTSRLSDGEEGFLPVLSKRILVTESLPLPIRGNQTREFNFDRLKLIEQSDSLVSQSFTVQMASNPSWYAVMALPYLMEYPHECSEQVFNRLYANSIGGHIVGSNPKIKRIFEQWRGTDALDSPLEKNEDIRNVLIAESPWLQDAKNESQSRRDVAILFDANRLNAESKRALNRLKQQQYSDGAWPWFPGGPANDYITLYVTTGFGRLRHLGVKVDVSPAIAALDRLDFWLNKRYQQILRNNTPDKNHLSPIICQYLYGRSFFLQDKPVEAKYKAAVDYFRNQGKQYWTGLNSRLAHGQLAIGLKRFGDLETPREILKSLTERSQTSDELGMYWQEDSARWWWYNAPIETQAMLIETYDEVAGDAEKVEECKIWLLKQKQTQNWKTTKATADAIYALLMRGTDRLASSNCLLYTSPSPRDQRGSRMPSSA